MSEETLVAVFDHGAQADAAARALLQEGIPVGDIEQHATAALTGAISAPDGGSTYWSALFGDATSREQNAVYDHTIRAGGEVMTVVMDEHEADRIMAILERFDPVNVADRVASMDVTQPAPSGTTGSPSQEEQVLRLSEEQLVVGKRLVDRGAMRLRRIVRTRAVEQTVMLRSEKVAVLRQAVASGQNVGLEAFADEVIEMTEMEEELVVSKIARVSEEIVLRKQVTERLETVRENLRREEVEVDRVPSSGLLPGNPPRS